MNRLEQAKAHKAIDDVLGDFISMPRPGRIMIRELILDALEGAGLELVSKRRDEPELFGDIVNRVVSNIPRNRPHPTDYGKLDDGGHDLEQ